jgi:hypothetical protein
MVEKAAIDVTTVSTMPTSSTVIIATPVSFLIL